MNRKWILTILLALAVTGLIVALRSVNLIAFLKRIHGG